MCGPACLKIVLAYFGVRTSEQLVAGDLFNVADLLVIDRDRLGTATPRLARDFPADSARFVVDASGYASVIVNGEVLLEDGRHTGALSGQVL